MKTCVFCGKPTFASYICHSCYSTTGCKILARRLLKGINKMAEADMLKGNPVTGAHYRAIEKLLKELK